MQLWVFQVFMQFNAWLVRSSHFSHALSVSLFNWIFKLTNMVIPTSCLHLCPVSYTFIKSIFSTSHSLLFHCEGHWNEETHFYVQQTNQGFIWALWHDICGSSHQKISPSGLKVSLENHHWLKSLLQSNDKGSHLPIRTNKATLSFFTKLRRLFVLPSASKIPTADRSPTEAHFTYCL